VEWTQESAIGYVELYKRKEIIWDPNHPKNFNKIKKKNKLQGRKCVILRGYSRLTYESPLAKKRSVSVNLS
jgi:hypothetical protein